MARKSRSEVQESRFSRIERADALYEFPNRFFQVVIPVAEAQSAFFPEPVDRCKLNQSTR